MFLILASSCVPGPWAGARMLEMLPAQDMGASFWLVELFRDGGEETKKRLDSRSTQLRFEQFNEPIVVQFVHRLVRHIWYCSYKNIFSSVLNLLSAELPDSRGICAVGEPNCVIEKLWLNLYLISQARPVACTQYESPSWWEGYSCTKTGHWTQQTSTALSHFEMEKRWPNFCLISQAARQCTWPSARRAQCVAASWWEGHSRFEDWTQHTFIAPFWCVVPRICHEW